MAKAPMRTHPVRVPDELWAAATEAAATHGDNLSDILRAALAAYVEEKKAQ